MGSLLTSLASRLRARIPQMSYKRRSFRSYRSYRDERDGASTWIPTSPIGSPTAPSSWQTFAPLLDAGNEKFSGRKDDLFTQDNRPRMTDSSFGSLSLPEFEFVTPAPAIPDAAYLRSPDPDVPRPAVSRSSASSRFLLGSGYLSSRSSGGLPNMLDGVSYQPENKSLPAYTDINGTERRTGSTAVPSYNFSSLGYAPSQSSSATPKLAPLPTPESEDSGIYVSSPIHPSFDVPQSVHFSSEMDRTTRSSATVASEGNRSTSRPFLLGTLLRDGSRRDPGRALPFPISSLRASRSSRQ